MFKLSMVFEFYFISFESRSINIILAKKKLDITKHNIDKWAEDQKEALTEYLKQKEKIEEIPKKKILPKKKRQKSCKVGGEIKKRNIKIF